MGTIAETIPALAHTISDSIGVRCSDYVPDEIQAPAAFVGDYEITEDSFGFGTMEVTIDVVFLAQRTPSKVGQAQLASYASQTGNQSVWLAIADNADLGMGDGTNARVQRVRTTGVVTLAGTDLLTLTASVVVTIQ